MVRGPRGRPRRTGCAAALLALAVLALPASIAAAPTWLLPAATVSDGGALDAAVAMDPSGNVAAVWDRHNGSTWVVEARVRPIGGPWGPVEPLGVTGTIAGGAQVVADRGGNAIAVWRDSSAIRAAVRPAGGSWTLDQPLATGDVDVPLLAVNAAGDATVAWRARPATYRIQAATRPAASGVWQSPQDVYIAPAGKLVVPVDVALDGVGNAAIVWSYFDTLTSRKLQASWRSAGASAWEAPVDLTGFSATCCPAQVAFDTAGTALAVWIDGGTTKAAHRPGAAGSWSTPEPLGPGGDNPHLAVGATGDAVAVWKRGVAVDAASRPAATGVWSAPRILTSSAETDPPQVAVDSTGHALAAWQLWDGARRNIEVARGEVATNSWERATPVSARGSEAYQPAVGVDAVGNGVAVFVEAESLSSATFVRAAPLDVAGPIFSGLSIPSAATAGAPVGFAVSSVDLWSPLHPGPYWDFGDGTFGLGSNVTHTYAAPGTYTVTVTHSDAVANTTTVRGSVSVAAQRPPAPPPAPPPARPAPRCVVPKVVGRKLARAKAAIKKARCRTGKVRRIYSKRRRAGFVLAQRPKPRTRLAVGGRVHLVVSRGKKPQRR